MLNYMRDFWKTSHVGLKRSFSSCQWGRKCASFSNAAHLRNTLRFLSHALASTFLWHAAVQHAGNRIRQSICTFCHQSLLYRGTRHCGETWNNHVFRKHKPVMHCYCQYLCPLYVKSSPDLLMALLSFASFFSSKLRRRFTSSFSGIPCNISVNLAYMFRRTALQR